MTSGQRPEPHVVDAMLRAFDVLDSVLDAESLQAAADRARSDLEVLPPALLLRVAVAIAVESARNLQTEEDRRRLRRRVARARLEVMWAGSADVEVES